MSAFIALTKPRIIELLLVTTVPTMFVAARGWPSAGLVLATLAGGTLSAGSANAANMYLDRDIDAIMRRTARRPLVTGTVSAPAALVFAVALQLAAVTVLWLAVNPLSAVLALSAALFYVFIYTALLKRTSPQNIVIGGAAGAVPVLVGWTAVTGSLGWAPLLLFSLVVLWTPPHFWALAIRYRDDYANANVPMMPVVQSIARTTWQMLAYSVATIAASAGFGAVAHMHWIYLGGSGGGRRHFCRAVRSDASDQDGGGGHEGLPLVHHLPEPAFCRHGRGRARPLIGPAVSGAPPAARRRRLHLLVSDR